MIKRISPQDPPKIPLKDFKNKELPPQRVIDPNLSLSERVALQKQIHKETFFEKALKYTNSYIENELQKQDMAEEDEFTKEQTLLEEKQIEEWKQEELLKRGDQKFFDPSSFQKAFIKNTENKFVIESRSTAPETDPSRPSIREIEPTNELAKQGFAESERKQKYLKKDKGLQKYVEDNPYYEYMIKDYTGINPKDKK